MVEHLERWWGQIIEELEKVFLYVYFLLQTTSVYIYDENSLGGYESCQLNSGAD